MRVRSTKEDGIVIANMEEATKVVLRFVTIDELEHLVQTNGIGFVEEYQAYCCEYLCLEIKEKFNIAYFCVIKKCS